MNLLQRAILLTAAILPVNAAIVGYETSYTVTLDSGVPNITNLQLIEEAHSSELGGFWSQGGPAMAFGGTTTALAGFIYDCPCLPVASIFGGIITDTLGQHSFALFMDDYAASLVEGTDWSAAFTGINEGELISGFPDGAVSFFSFAFAAQSSIQDSGGQTVSALFDPSGSFSVLRWSDGVRIGFGTGTVTPIFGTVPEPSGTLYFGCALGLFCLWRQARTEGEK
jgi:hypothetical protein